MAEKRTQFGRDLESAFGEVIAHRRGKIALPTHIIDPMPPTRVKEIRKRFAKTPKDFERRFGVPARTIEGWEQGRKLDVAGRVLLTVIEQNPTAVEQVVSGSARRTSMSSSAPDRLAGRKRAAAHRAPAAHGERSRRHSPTA